MYDIVRYTVVPPCFIVLFTGLVQVLALYGRGEILTVSSVAAGFIGNEESWGIVVVFCLWAFLWLKAPGPSACGPTSPTGQIPLYKNNGLEYYFATLLSVAFIDVCTPLRLSSRLYDLMPQLLGTLNVVAMALCLFLFLSPSDEPESDVGLPALFVFYRGVNFHPRLFGVDVKQLTNCRVGLMAWQILVWAFFVVSVEKQGFSMASFTTFLLQTVYLAKFFYWEIGYFHTIDIILDRAGYYICWGCLVWVPCFYTFTSYYMVAHEPVMDSLSANCVLAAGLASIYLNYQVDAQKQKFRATDGNCLIRGKPAQYLTAFYTDHLGKKQKSLLLTSGYWGIARHLNYDFELVLTLCWCLPGLGLGLPPFFYTIFLSCLLVHRIFRDEEKCIKKYGVFWYKYCEMVPYRLIPNVF